MKRSILSFVILSLFLMGFVIVQGQAVCSASVNTGINLSDDPNEPVAESGLAFGQIVCLEEDPNDGSSVAE